MYRRATGVDFPHTLTVLAVLYCGMLEEEQLWEASLERLGSFTAFIP